MTTVRRRPQVLGIGYEGATLSIFLPIDRDYIVLKRYDLCTTPSVMSCLLGMERGRNASNALVIFSAKVFIYLLESQNLIWLFLEAESPQSSAL